jgi:hypothetical protein
MKTSGLMLIAILFSGATFAQDATVKAEQTTSVTTAKGNATVKSDITADNQASAIKSTADEKMNTAMETGKQSTVHLAQGIKSSLNTSAGISGNLLKTTNLKIAPVKINTRIVSRTGLFIR